MSIIGRPVVLGKGIGASIKLTGSVASTDTITCTKGGPRLPAEYQEVEYIESSGTQYIDTGLTGGSTVPNIEMKLNLLDMSQGSDWVSIIGSDTNYDHHIFRILKGTDNSTIHFIGLRSADDVIGTAISSNQVYLFKTNISGQFYIDGVLKGTITPDGNYNSWGSISQCVFIANDNIGEGKNGIPMRLYYLKMYQGDVLQRDFVPCKNTNNEYGLFDLVSNTFFGNVGTGSFTGGPNIYYPPAKSKQAKWVTRTITTTSFKYLKWSITKIKSATTVIQMSEFKMLDSEDNYISWSGAAATSSKTGFSGEEVDKILDGNVDTKYCATWASSSTQTGTCDIIINLKSGIDISKYNRYQYYTANDQESRDPISWTISVSNDGTNWHTISTVSSATITSTRKALAGTWTVDEYEETITENVWKISDIDEYGTWVVTASNGTNIKTYDVLIDSIEEYEIQVSYPRLPDIYQEVEYLQSSGTQWISLDWTIPDVKRQLKVAVDFQYSSVPTSGIQTLMGRTVTTTSGNDRYLILSRVFYYDGSLYKSLFQYGSSGVDVIASSSSSSLLTRNIYTLDVINSLATVANQSTGSVIGSTSITVDSDMDSIASGYQLGLLTWFSTASGATELCKGKLYSCQVYKSSNLFRNYIPCYRKSDSVAGLYDLVTNTFLTNSGTGTFVVGGDV